MKKGEDTISFDLFRGGNITLDVSSFFPVSELHAIRVEKPSIDSITTLSLGEIDLSLPSFLSVSPLREYGMLDIAPATHARRRRLSVSPEGVEEGSVIDLFPPLSPPYGALDIRGEPIIAEEKYGDIYRRSLPWSLHARRIVRDSARTLRKKRRPLALALLVAVGLTLPTLFYTKYLIESGYSALEEIKTAGSKIEIESLVKRSRGNFERANILFTPFRIIPGDSVRLASIALYGGLALTRGVDHVIADLPEALSGSTLADISTDTIDSYRPAAQSLSTLSLLGIAEPTTWMREHRSTLDYFTRALSEAGTIYARASDIDHPRSREIAHIGRGLTQMSSLLSGYLAHESDVLALLGADIPERYIILNQNRDEIRANGGFPGSVITFTIFRGNISDYRTDDVYYYDWNLYPFKEAPPPGLALISGNYGLRDVNYYADFRQTLEKANSFIERSGDPTVTVGIALHQGLIEDILGAIGPVTLSGVTEPFVKENFSLLMSTLVEARYGQETSAKDILRKFVDAFVRKIHEKRAYEEVITTVIDAVKNGEILFASRNDRLDAFLTKYKKPLPWQSPLPEVVSGDVSISSGSVSKSNWAYPLLTSLSGNKSDRYIERSYTAETTMLTSCQYMDKLTFTHRHTYTKDIERQVRSYLTQMGIGDAPSVTKMLAIQGAGANKSYIRLLLPITAALTGATAGVEVDTTPSAREFSFTLDTPAGSIASKTIRYTVDIPDCQNEGAPLTWYRQPGLKSVIFQSR